MIYRPLSRFLLSSVYLPILTGAHAQGPELPLVAGDSDVANALNVRYHLYN